MRRKRRGKEGGKKGRDKGKKSCVLLEKGPVCFF